jgi:hypothetical protein
MITATAFLYTLAAIAAFGIACGAFALKQAFNRGSQE